MRSTTVPVPRKRQRRQRADQTTDRSHPFHPHVDTPQRRPKLHPASPEPGLEAQHEALRALRARLRGNVAQTADAVLGGRGIETTSASPDAADRASESLEQDLALSMLGNAAGILAQVEDAIQRIENGTYGRCTNCDTEIAAARLEAIPYTPTCIDCAAREERKRQQ